MEGNTSIESSRGEWPGKTISPREWPLPEGGYKKFNINDIFLSYSGDFDIQSKHLSNKGDFVVSAGSNNNGIIGRTLVDAKVFRRCITIDMFGNTYFQPYDFKMVTHARVFALESKMSVSNRVYLYFTSVLAKLLSSRFSYSDMASWNKIKNDFIMLPTNAIGSIDFDFMELRIRELEELRIRELEAYLSEAGFDNCELTDDEAKAISILLTKEFTTKSIYNDIFNVTNSHNILKSDVILGSGTTPYVTAGEGNNSVMGYISYKSDMVEPGNTILIGGKTMVVTYQSQDFFSNDSHNLVLSLKEENYRTENVYLFLVAALKKALGHKYSWGDSISKQKIKGDVVNIPITKDNKIDYDFMSNLISAIKKIVIANLEDFIAKEKQTYREIIK